MNKAGSIKMVSRIVLFSTHGPRSDFTQDRTKHFDEATFLQMSLLSHQPHLDENGHQKKDMDKSYPWYFASSCWIIVWSVELQYHLFLPGFQDFAGSAVVHLTGAVCALVGCMLMGPRHGRFDKSGRPVPMPGHSVPLSALGGLILVFGFFACNGTKQVILQQAFGDNSIQPILCWVSETLRFFTAFAVMPLPPEFI